MPTGITTTAMATVAVALTITMAARAMTSGQAQAIMAAEYTGALKAATAIITIVLATITGRGLRIIMVHNDPTVSIDQ